MESDIEQARASNMEEDKASAPNKGKAIDVRSASDRSDCCIYRVPKRFRDVNWEAYYPQLISIGPLGYNKRKRAMENKKGIYFKKFTGQDGKDKEKISDIKIRIKNQEKRLRNCYSEKFDSMESCDFIQMILLDAVFIIEFMKESNNDEGPKVFKPNQISEIREDLMILENQLPFFIIKEIYDQLYPPRQDETYISFLELLTFLFGNYSFLRGEKNNPSLNESKHFTDLIRNFMLSKANNQSNSLDPIMLKYSADRLRNAGPIMLKYSADRLRNAGVKFQATKDQCLVNITFENGVLNIPRLEIDYRFERLVRNIMALEQCLYEEEAHICSYIKFLDQLINSAEDVRLLVENGIIVHRLGDNAAVSNMINKFCENIGDTCAYYNVTCHEMNEHYKSRCNRTMATLKLVYFPNVWRGTGTLAAAVLLILTLIQTIKSFL